MTQETEQIPSSSESEVISESLKLKLNFAQRNWQRAKQENARLTLKLKKIQEENQEWNDEKRSLLETIQKLERVVARQQEEKQGLTKKIEVRTQRHQREQSKNLSLEEKEKVEGRVRRAEAELQVFKNQQQVHSKRYQNLSLQLQNERKQSYRLRQQIVTLQKQKVADLDAMQSVESLYKEKTNVLQAENDSLKKQLDSLVIDLRLLERKNEIEGLLSYEQKIGLENSGKSLHKRKISRALNFDQNCDPNLLSRQCCCEELQMEMYEKDELIELLKERNSRLSSQFEGLKRRFSNLQNIICSSGMQ